MRSMFMFLTANKCLSKTIRAFPRSLYIVFRSVRSNERKVKRETWLRSTQPPMIAPESSTHDFQGSASPTTIVKSSTRSLIWHQETEINIPIVDFLVEIMKYATMAAVI